MSYTSNEVAGEITRLIGNHIKGNKLAGSVLPEESYQCFEKPGRARRPDVSYINPSRVPAARPKADVKFAPDLAVEVISRTDNVVELETKLADHRQVGVPLIWVVYPEARLIPMHRKNESKIDEMRDGDVLRGDEVLPGFEANVTDLLPARAVETGTSK